MPANSKGAAEGNRIVSRGYNSRNEGLRTRGPERDRAKVQIGAELLCKSAKVNHNNPWCRVMGTGIRSSGAGSWHQESGG